MATTPKTDMLCKLLSSQTFQKKIQVFWDIVSHMHCSFGKTTDEISTLITEELGISLSTLNVII